ncbi:MAG: YcxB family protein [Burkholderiaceae bacterium]|nr:MAG: YcxB family protein [Burkholderiaceae bacterium]
MEFTLTYSSSRAEVMRLYWRLWKARLWRVHLVVFSISAFGAYTLLEGHETFQGRLVGSALAGAACIALFIAYPLLAFKSQSRVVVVNEVGISTSIGTKHGALAWSDVQSIERTSECVYIIRKTLNAYIIPNRAFKSNAEANEFFRAISSWLRPGG